MAALCDHSGWRPPDTPTLDLNKLNYDEIEFGYMRSGGTTPIFVVKHRGSPFISGFISVSMERIQRGWGLIMQSCPGVRKAF
jgi:hypothetical protein